MAGFGFAVSLTSAWDPRSAVTPLADGAAHRGPGRTSASVARAAATALGDGASVATDESGRLIVADSRLDERAALARRLDRTTTDSDAELILAAFDRWGDDCAAELLGDFAFAIWDAPRGSMFAARDIFGTRPFFYAAIGDRLLAGSEIGQLLATGLVPRQVDDRSLIASLAGRTSSPGWTPFEAVRRLRPGHVLRADRAGVRSRRFWQPPRHATDRASGAEYALELQELVRTVVGARVRATAQPGLLLSGGLDSVSIAAVSAALRAEDPGLPLLHTYSFGYDGFPEADERSISDPLTTLLGQPNTVIPGADAFPLADFANRAPDLDGPELLHSHLLMRHAAEQAASDGVQLMMTGHRSDPLFAEGIFDYLGVLRRGGPMNVLAQARRQASRERTTTRAVLKRDLLRRAPAALWPRYRSTAARDWFRRAVPGGVALPPWVRADALVAHGLEHGAVEAVPASRLAGEARRRRHEAIAWPGHAASAEYLERLNAQAGIRYADPWSDRRLADWVLSIPPARITVEGTDKWVLREAMRGTVPDYARDSGIKAHPGSFYEHGVLTGSRSAIRELLERPRTAERGYVDAGELQRAYVRYQAQGRPRLLEWNAFWRWAMLEHWMRAHDL
ncbi:MAG: asparagine synthase-related protein [Chloroflexi bacterium]|nr:asparagine synthase-related protein [Chloroflexota bacterium]